MVLKAGPAQVEPVPTASMPAPAQRPLNSRLDTSKLRTAFGIRLPSWKAGVEAAVGELARS
jgi:dTDP-4-dehydrorhamnose reductase